MVIVVNSTVLIGLARIKKLEILQKLYGQIYVAASVYDEVVLDSADMPGADEIKAAEWIQKREIKDTITYRVLQSDIDPGEAGTVILAIELGADLVILDESKARRIASYVGLNVIGTIGVLVAAKQASIIDEVKLYLDQLRKEEFWIADTLYEKVLKSEGESIT